MSELVKRHTRLADVLHRLHAGDWSAAVGAFDMLTEEGRGEDARRLAGMLQSHGRYAGNFPETLEHIFAADMFTVESLAGVAGSAQPPTYITHVAGEPMDPPASLDIPFGLEAGRMITLPPGYEVRQEQGINTDAFMSFGRPVDDRPVVAAHNAQREADARVVAAEAVRLVERVVGEPSPDAPDGRTRRQVAIDTAIAMSGIADLIRNGGTA